MAPVWLTKSLKDPPCGDWQLAPRKRFSQKLPGKGWCIRCVAYVKTGATYWNTASQKRKVFYASHRIFLALQELKSFYRFAWSSLWLLDKGLTLAEKNQGLKKLPLRALFPVCCIQGTCTNKRWLPSRLLPAEYPSATWKFLQTLALSAL